jgi:hypothetical protein
MFSDFIRTIDHNSVILDREIVAAYNYMDLEQHGSVNKTFFEQEVRNALKAAAIEMGLNSSALLGRTG